MIGTLTSKVIGSYFNSTEYKNTFGINKAKFKIKNNKIEAIDEYAFSGCKALIKINIPKSTNEIFDGAFSGCKSSNEMTIPKNVTKINNNAINLLKICYTYHL